ncbi:MAG: hypothetical protein ACI4D4_05900 [Lachnospira sp.]
MPLINKDKVLNGVSKAVDVTNNAADKVSGYVKENELDKKAVKVAKEAESAIVSMGKSLEDAFNNTFCTKK